MRRTVSPDPRGVLHALETGAYRLHRAAPPAELQDWVEHFWRVRWDLTGQAPRVQETLPHPNVHLVLEPGEAAVHGIWPGRWTRLLQGRSQAFGIKFRAGGFRPWLGRPVSAIAGRAVPAQEVFGPHASALASVLDLDDDAACAQASRFLLARLPAQDENALLAGRIVDSVVDARDLHTVAQLAQRHGLGVRSLQRLFSEYVGASPKWVINRYRMHEAVARAQAGEPVSWAALAQDLGYFDQAHFIADFRKLVGRTPQDYSRHYAPGR